MSATTTVIHATARGVLTRLNEVGFIDLKHMNLDAQNEYSLELIPFVAGMLAASNDFAPPTIDAIAEAWIYYTVESHSS